jgi:hypothetical protein
MLEVVFGIIDLALVAAYVAWDYLKIYEDKETAFQWFLIFQFQILFAYLLARVKVERSKIEASNAKLLAEIHGLRRSINHNTVALRQDQFYSDFHLDISMATAAVDISHLDIRPPLDAALPGSETRRYYDDFARTVRTRGNVRFRRIERVSRQKREWLEHLVDEFTGRANFSLACLVTPEEDRKIGAISVQLVDARKVYLVAIREHSSAHAVRDILAALVVP